MPNKTRFISTVLVASLFTFAASSASADEAPLGAEPSPAREGGATDPHAPAPFGSRGQFALDDLLGFHLYSVAIAQPGATTIGASGIVSYMTSSSSVTYNEVPGGPSGSPISTQFTQITFSPSFDYFISDRISVGGVVGIGYQRSRGSALTETGERTVYVQSGYALSLRPRIGYVSRLTDDIALWPRISVGYAVSRASADEGPEDRALSKMYSAEAELGVVVRLGQRAYLNVGPTLTYNSSTSEGSAPGSIGGESSGLGGGARGTFGLLL